MLIDSTMLLSLRISNFALIDHLEIEFSRGLNVLTGETGAGKSIILDAIDVVLGGKAHQRMIRRSGVDKTLLEATFTLNAEILDWLQQQSIDPLEDGCLVCSRELTQGNSLRSRSRVNGVLVNRPLMAELRDKLVEITAQGQTVQLMIPDQQRQLLDLYGGKVLLQQRQKVTETHEQCQKLKQNIEKRRQSEQQRLQRLDLLDYQIKELQNAKIEDADELNQLEQERDRLTHVVQLQQMSYQIYQLLYQNDRDEPAIADLLGKAETFLQDMTRYDPEIASILDLIRSAFTQINEASQQINAYGESLESDPERLAEVHERLHLLKQICRKYGPTLGEAISYYDTLQQELLELTDQGQSLDELEEQYQVTYEELTKLCQELTQLRLSSAQKLEQQLVKELKPLAMDKVIFECRLIPTAPATHGAEQVHFYFSPNAGEPVQPLSMTASGGEMSRFLLALKACFSLSEGKETTLIFDEIDAGVSGKVAQSIAEKLHQLSHHHQVLCVTHQPLVAVMADHHFRVEKEVLNGVSSKEEMRTVVRIYQLDTDHTRRDELALLTGGHSAQEALSFAESLLAQVARNRKMT